MARPATKSPDTWRDDIKRTAHRLFAEKGFQAVSVDAIMSEVGAAKGTFYRFFPGKDELLGELVEDWLHDYAAAVSRALEDEGAPLPQKFEMVADAMARMVDATTGLDAFLTDSGRNADALRLASDKMAELLVPYLESALESALEKGEIAIGDAGFTARFIVCGSLGALNAGGGAPSERIRENMAHLPKAIARILGMDPRKLTLDKEA